MESKRISTSSIIIGLVVIALITYGIISYTSSDSILEKEGSIMMIDDKMMQDNGMIMEKPTDAVVMQHREVIMQKEATMKNDTVVMKEAEMMKKDSMIVKAGSYMNYDAAKVTLAAETDKAVLFFHAPWCPTCRAADAEFLKMVNSIPTGVTIFKVDYDSSTELKKKYGVTTQHTFVQVDARGGMMNSWRSSTTVADIVAKIK